MTKKSLLIVLMIVVLFSFFTLILSPTKSLAQNGTKKSFVSSLSETLNTIKLNLVKEFKKTPSTSIIENPIVEVPRIDVSSGPEADTKGDMISDDVPKGLHIIAMYESAYLKAVAKSVYPGLTDDNFESWDNFHGPIRPIFNSISERYKNLPAQQWPIIVMPTANFEAINNLIKNEYPEPNGLNIVIPYVSFATSDMPNTYNTVATFKVALVAGGFDLNDWTKGNKFDFIDSSEIQYVNPEPKTQYPITAITPNATSTVIYNSTLPYHVRVGWLVWLNLKGSTGQVYQRYNITSVSTTGGYITVNSRINIGNLISGTAQVNYLSGVTAVVATKLKQIMIGANCSFNEAIEYAKATASNNGVRNNETGYGRINVPDAIKYGLDLKGEL